MALADATHIDINYYTLSRVGGSRSWENAVFLKTWMPDRLRRSGAPANVDDDKRDTVNSHGLIIFYHSNKTHPKEEAKMTPDRRREAVMAIAEAGRQLANRLKGRSLSKADVLSTIIFRAMYYGGMHEAVVELATDVIRHPNRYTPAMVEAVRTISPILDAAFATNYQTPRQSYLSEELRQLALAP